MIHYALRCDAAHSFDGWFRSSAAFDQQAKAGLLACPLCASTQVSRAIMSPRLSGNAAAPPEPAAQVASPPPSGSIIPASPAPEQIALGGPPPMPDRVRAMLQRIRAEIESRCDYVGPHFASAAREMHAGITPPRPIYGETTPEEAEALADDGIEVARVPWVPRADG